MFEQALGEQVAEVWQMTDDSVDSGRQEPLPVPLYVPAGSVVEDQPSDAGDVGSIPGWGRSPGGGNATHSSTLAWEIPWTEKPGGLRSMGSQRVRHNFVMKIRGDPPYSLVLLTVCVCFCSRIAELSCNRDIKV